VSPGKNKKKNKGDPPEYPSTTPEGAVKEYPGGCSVLKPKP